MSFTATATDVSPAVQAAGFTYSWNFGDGRHGDRRQPQPHVCVRRDLHGDGDGDGRVRQDGHGKRHDRRQQFQPHGHDYTLTTPNPATGSIGTASGAFTVALPTGSDGRLSGDSDPQRRRRRRNVHAGSSQPLELEHFRYFHLYAGNRRGDHHHHDEQRGLTNPGPVLYLDNNPALITEQFDFGTAVRHVATGYTGSVRRPSLVLP